MDKIIEWLKITAPKNEPFDAQKVKKIVVFLELILPWVRY